MTSYAAAPPHGRSDAGTPFYNHLMSMIDETALENRLSQQALETDAGPPAANHSWLTGHLIASAAVLTLVVAVGSAIAGLRVGPSGLPVAAADSASVTTSPVGASTATAEAPVAPAPPVAKPDGFGQVDVKGAGATDTAEGGIETGSVSVAKADESPQAKPADEPTESPGSGVKTESDGSESPPAATSPAPAEAVAPPEAPPSKASPTQSIETGSIVKSPAAGRIARMLSDANMRSGPGNSHPVLVAVPRGTAVELISCRHWCEVIVGGQRGWVYKDFVGEISDGH
jgi:hypothetical protein